MEEALFAWFMDLRAKNSIPVSGDLLQQKARSFACLLGDNEFKASPGFGTLGPETAEAGPDCASAVHEDEDAWEHLRSVDEVPTGISFSDYVNADANAVTTEVLTDADMLRLVGSVEGVTAEDAADDPAGAEAPVPTPGQVMDALDLLRHFAGAHEGTEDELDALQTYEKSVRPLLTKRTQAKITDFFGGK
ncbi:hypothetical protein V5799_030134 [Amblyomma americanum]|uniref:HTH CENPB-type domain-containing protein n=1 Tax=Amblyomma americanum TaxID=6943 RepID=A0AAQ4EPS1_AMBAM